MGADMPTSNWCFFVREPDKPMNRKKQMIPDKGSALRNMPRNWRSLDWDAAERHVKRLQVRIAKAVEEKKWGKVKALQWTLTHSFYAKALAVRRVTRNKGARTPGIDKARWRTDGRKLAAVLQLKRHGYRAKALRRIYILKKNGKKRPLSIPTMNDRAMQALYALALIPVAEALADPNSYGFREGRCCQDALEQCFVILARRVSPGWILEADIKGCFDNISHEWLMNHIPLDKSILRQWLEVGYIEEGEWFRSEAGTPQGGIVSPILANLTLNGLEKAIKASVPSTETGVNVVRYADDFIVTARSPERLTETIRPVIERFLAERGLSLSEEKTKITSIDEGFDFLGQNARKYEGKLLIKPSKTSTQGLLDKVRLIIDAHKGKSAERLIKVLNPVIRGWANYHRHSVCAQTFYYIDYVISGALFRWIRKRNQNKSKSWIVWKHFRSPLDKSGTFCAKSKNKKGQTVYYHLQKALNIPRALHRKVIGKAHPYQPEKAEYFAKRQLKRYRTKGRMSQPMQWIQAHLGFQP